MGLRFPEGRTFAFTIMDDTDVATVENVRPIYRLLEQLGLRTTKTVWPVACPEGSPNFASSETLEDPEYLAFVLDLKERGFEIAYHGATMESSTRDRTERALARFRKHFGGSPKVYANHSYNRENLYWGEERVDDPLIRFFYARTNGMPRDHYQGGREGSAWWWGDLARSIPYVRNLTFSSLNTLAVNPSMPYHDPNRPLVEWWFSAADAEDVDAFNRLLRPEEQDRLESEGGASIVATHLGKEFVRDGRVHPETERLLTRLAAKPGWFVPVSELLTWLRMTRNENSALPSAEWHRMQWRWIKDLVGRKLARLSIRRTR